MTKVRLLACALLPAFLFVQAPASLACEGKTVILAEDFQDDLGGWDEDKRVRIDKKAAFVLEPNDLVGLQLNNSYAVKDADICVDVGLPPQRSEMRQSVGLTFWASDYQNYFLFIADRQYGARLLRRTDGQWTVIYSHETPNFKSEPGAMNVLRVRTKGNLITTYLNGQKIRDVRGQNPTTASRFGYFVEVGKPVAEEAARTFTIKGYKVTSVD